LQQPPVVRSVKASAYSDQIMSSPVRESGAMANNFFKDIQVNYNNLN